MEKYVKPEIEIISFVAENVTDVGTGSGEHEVPEEE